MLLRKLIIAQRPRHRQRDERPEYNLYVMGRTLIGTCSWTDKSLVQCGRFYPSQITTPEERLRFYASRFPTVEVDSTYYALPSERNSALWVERTPQDFVFHVKAFALFTQHAASVSSLPREVRDALPAETQDKARIYPRDLPHDILESLWRSFEEALLPLDSAGKLGLVLFQFPPWFTPRRENRDYILRCLEHLPQYRLAIEFRNAAWLRDDIVQRTLTFLQKNGLTFVSVDEPQGFRSSIPPLATATTDTAYVRFHGRNREAWERRGKAASERFDYYYSRDELEEWVPRIRNLQEQTKETHVLFNTNYQDQGIVNAVSLAGLLGEGVRPSSS